MQIKRRWRILMRSFQLKKSYLLYRVLGKQIKTHNIVPSKTPLRTVVPNGMTITEWYKGGYSNYLNNGKEK